MSQRYAAQPGANGQFLQSGISKRPKDPEGHRPQGLLVRGVVVATYVQDDDNHPYKDLQSEEGKPAAVYCDVLVYSSVPKLRFGILRTVLVAQHRGGLHDDRIWKPKAAKIDIGADGLDLSKRMNPATMDGDHVLVGFIDDLLSQPIILRGIPHPKADVGNNESGRQLKLKLADGDPDFWKHHGTLYGVTKAGDFLVDTRFANDGQLGSDGKEPSQNGGEVKFRLPNGKTFIIEVNGDSSKHVAVVEYLKDLYNNLKSYIENAQVMTSMGPSGTISAQSGPAPSWDSHIESNRVVIPDNS